MVTYEQIICTVICFIAVLKPRCLVRTLRDHLYFDDRYKWGVHARVYYAMKKQLLQHSPLVRNKNNKN
jgi:hypothetical protein